MPTVEDTGHSETVSHVYRHTFLPPSSVLSDIHWLAFGVSETLIVAQAVDLKKLAGFRVFFPYPLHHN